MEIKQAKEKRIRDQQAQDLLNKQDAVAHAVNNPPVQHVYHSGGGGGGGGGCTIMWFGSWL